MYLLVLCVIYAQIDFIITAGLVYLDGIPNDEKQNLEGGISVQVLNSHLTIFFYFTKDWN